MKPRDLRHLASRRALIRVTAPGGQTWTGRLLHYRAGPTLVLADGPDITGLTCLPADYQVTVLEDDQAAAVARMAAAIDRIWAPTDADACARQLLAELRKDMTP